VFSKDRSRPNVLASAKSQMPNLLKTGEPGRTRTFNPLLVPEILCSWLFKHFLASYITVFHGVRQSFVPKVVPPRRKEPSVYPLVPGIGEARKSA